MYLIIAMIWLLFGVLVQIFWSDLEPVMRVRPDRAVVGVLTAVLVLYNLMRWRMTWIDVPQPPPPPTVPKRVEGEYNPNLDFTRLEDPEKKPPPS